MFKIILVIGIVILVLWVHCDDNVIVGKEIDYSHIAGEAERNKDDILNFLNQSTVKEKYKTLYQILLKKLLSESAVGVNFLIQSK